MMTPIVDLRELSVVRGDVKILDGLTWRVEPGEHWALLGPNGSGKTSLLSVLAGHLQPDHGTAEVLGGPPGREKTGIVSSSLMARIGSQETALDVVKGGLGLWERMFSQDQPRALRAMRLTECRELADRPWNVLSQGEKQRVLISRALVLRPKLLILDEPSTGLDFPARERFLTFLRRFARQPGAPTIILATHHADEISTAFKKVLILRKARLSAAGPIGDVLTSDNVSRAFGTRLRVKCRRGRYFLARPPRKPA
jgi:iron complex transport system ATP-binding protein